MAHIGRPVPSVWVERDSSNRWNGQWNVIVGAVGCTMVALYLLISASRPAASFWSLVAPWFWSTIAAAAFGLMAGGRPRVLRTLAILTAAVIGPVAVIAMSGTVGQAVSTLTFRSEFVAFAEHADQADNSERERFRIGPFVYNQRCVQEEAVFVWHADDSFFFSVPAVRIGADGTVSQVWIDEFDSALTCLRGG